MTFPNPSPLRTLSPEDASTVDRLLEDGLDPERLETLSGDERTRGEAVLSLLGKLDQYPVEDASEDLVSATLARVARAEDEQGDRMRLDPASQDSTRLQGRRWRLPDLFATAAMLLLAVGIIWPIANSMSTHRMVALDQANFMELNASLGTFSSSNNGSTPMEAAASLLPDPLDWLGGHAGMHNAAIQKTFGADAQENDFYMPEGHRARDAYSFQVWSPDLDLSHSEQPIAANTNPLPALIAADRSTQLTISEAIRNSASHRGSGQNVLFGDGSVRLVRVSELEGNRIWDAGTGDGEFILGVIRGDEPVHDMVFLIH